VHYAFRFDLRNLEEAQIVKNLIDIQAHFVGTGYHKELDRAL
jgi:hypothetical protein